MNTKIKSLARLLLLTLFFNLTGCSVEEETIKHNSSVNNNEISFKKFKNETGIKNFQTLKSVNFGSKTSRTIKSEFITDTTKIVKFSVNNKTTYSFRIYPIKEELGSNEYYNLVYEKTANGLNEIIFKNTEKKDLKTGYLMLQSSDMIYNSKFLSKNKPSVDGRYTSVSMSEFCEVVTYSFHCTCSDKSNCDGCSQCVSVSVSYEYCGNSGGGSDSGGGSGGIIIGDDSGGGGGDDSGIYVPNPYDGEADVNNANFILAVDVGRFLQQNQLFQNMTINSQNAWMFPTIVDFVKNNGNLSEQNKDIISNALQSFNSVLNLQLPNWSANEINQFYYNSLNFLLNNPDKNSDFIEYNRTNFDYDTGDLDNNTEGNFDNTVYDNFNPQQQPWTNVSSVVPSNNFVGWGTSGIRRNCMDYAKAQIAKVGYQISNYGATGQTFQIYTASNGVNTTALANGLSYLKYALSKGIPVIVGIDDAQGSPNSGTDNTTNHFVVIVGMGSNNNGNYFQFYDNASGQVSQGTSPLNLLYYNPSTGLISGTSQCSGYAQGMTYTITMIRKSKLL